MDLWGRAQFLKRPIGEGSLGSVHLGRWQETDVAVKLLVSLQDICSATDNLDTGTSGLAKHDAPPQDPEAGLRGLEREVCLPKLVGVLAILRAQTPSVRYLSFSCTVVGGAPSGCRGGASVVARWG
jgi:hypothetical protein